MVSGIGPKATLENLGIPVIVDRESVGQNMWDQFFFPLFQEADFETQSGLSSPTAAATAAELYNANRTGILTSNGGDFFGESSMDPKIRYNTSFDCIGWEKLPPASRANLSTAALADLATFPPDWPENELIISTLANPVGVVGQNYALVVGGLMTPLSRGNVTIISSDTSDLSVFNPNYLLSTTDQEVAVQMFRRARALLNSPAFASILIGEESVPGIAVQTDAEILAFLKTAVSPSYHPACSCKYKDLVLLREGVS
jgi:choline dehydrogenase